MLQFLPENETESRKRAHQTLKGPDLRLARLLRRQRGLGTFRDGRGLVTFRHGPASVSCQRFHW